MANAVGGGSRANGAGPGGSGAQSQAQIMQNTAKQYRAASSLANAQMQYVKTLQKAQQFNNPTSNSAKAFNKLVYSTRVGMGSNGMSVMPLVGDLVRVMAQLGPAGEAAAMGMGMLLAQLEAVKTSAAYGKEMAGAYYQGGGTMAQTVRLAAVGAVAGLSTAQMTQMANSFNGSMQNNPYLLGRAAAGGYSPNYAGPYGDINNTGRFLNAIKDMLSAPTDQAAQRMSQGTELSSLIWLRSVDPQVLKEFQNAITTMTDAKMVKEQATAQVALNTAQFESQQLMVKLGNEYLPTVNKALKFAVEHFDQLSAVLNFAAKSPVISVLERIFGGSPAMQAEKDKAKSQAEHTKALDDHTRALIENTKALTNERQTYGGGSNMANAVNRMHWRGTANEQIKLGQIPI